MRIVVLEVYNLIPWNLAGDEMLEKFGKVMLHEPTAPDQILKRCKNAESVLPIKLVAYCPLFPET